MAKMTRQWAPRPPRIAAPDSPFRALRGRDTPTVSINSACASGEPQGPLPPHPRPVGTITAEASPRQEAGIRSATAHLIPVQKSALLTRQPRREAQHASETILRAGLCTEVVGTPDQFVVGGEVRREDGRELAGTTCRAFHKHPKGEAPLGEPKTNAKGHTAWWPPRPQAWSARAASANAVADVYRPRLETSPAPSQRRRSLFRRVWDALRRRLSVHPHPRIVIATAARRRPPPGADQAR
jgi:hypothetical protein